MKETPLCSVVIPCYNEGGMLEQCLDSVFAQTYPHWELVLVDDASTDGTCEAIYRKYENHPRVRIYYNDRNGGIGFTKRRGVEEARGELCTILDRDDTIVPEALEILVEHHRKKPGASIVCSRKNWCDAELTPRFPDDWDHQGEEVRYTGIDQYVWVSHLCMFKMESYRRTEGIDPSLRIGEDHDMYLKLGEVGEVWCIKDILHNYRVHEGGSSAHERKHWARYWSLVVVMRACERCGEDPAVVVPRTLAHDERIWQKNLRRELQKYEQSHSYRLGRFLLTPLRVAKHLRPGHRNRSLDPCTRSGETATSSRRSRSSTG